MLNEQAMPQGRQSVHKTIDADLVVVGGGISGVCAAIAAARSGVKVTLVQDRPVLGGNASSEVRLWILGATSHMGNNNRWSREGGVINEILLENMFRNKEGNTVIFDTILLDKVTSEPNIKLLLNTAVFATHKSSDTKIESVEAFCSQNSIMYQLTGKYFCDASGDGIVAFQAGASFRIGAESRDEFGEKMAPPDENKELLGHSIYFYSKDAGKPVKFVAPSYASIDKMALDRIKRIKRDDIGPRLWWLEYGGNSDTIGETEEIKWELWKVVYGVWDYIKNSGKFDGVDNLTLEWVGNIPGKRESRRFMGHYFMVQQDVVEQHQFDDAISYGGWAIDHHPGDGVYSDRPPCTQYHAKGVYQIPLRCFVSKDMDNLFLAGRIISVSHIAFGSTRVMATSGHGGQAVGSAVAYCLQKQITPTELWQSTHIGRLQQTLNQQGHFIPGVPMQSSNNLAAKAQITASSELSLTNLPDDGLWKPLKVSAGQFLPLKKDTAYQFDVRVKVHQPTTLTTQLCVSQQAQNYTPEQIIEQQQFELQAGDHHLSIKFDNTLQQDLYAMLCFLQNEHIEIACSHTRISGLVSVFNGENKAVSNKGKQIVEGDIGMHEFEFWTPERRPNGHNIAMHISPAIEDFSASNLTNGYSRPYLKSNAWVADTEQASAELTLDWPEEQTVSEIILHLDGDFDHALESSLMGHPEDRIPFCVANYRIVDENDNLLIAVKDNYQSLNHLKLDNPVKVRQLKIQLERANQHVPVALFEVIVK
ncbi:FAD-dependent oxidoreductase [Neptunicella sp.]|uniref:FAD-dependent oxidoreductase n=1 Tax=Neptunicella sp. TaxID=2125986 RepID=UPI003F6918ED